MKSRLPEFLLLQTEDEKAKSTLAKYRHNIEAFLEWLPDDVEICKTVVIDFKRHLLDDKQLLLSAISRMETEAKR